MLAIGDTPPDFSLNNQDGEAVHSKDLRGSWVVVFAYPKANTPGCTTEACEFRDLNTEFAAAGATVLGISADSVRAQGNFRTKHGLTTPLLSDPERTVLEPWGIWGEKKNYGRTYMGIIRSTFVLDPEGKVAFVWPKVRVKGHVDAVLAKVRELAGE